MEKSQVPWKKDLSYEELVKQCPYLAQQRGIPLETQLPEDLHVHEVTLSKSKKKRLKRKLKNLTATSKPTISEEAVCNTLQEKFTTAGSSKELSRGSLESDKMDKSKSQLGEKQRVPDVVDGEILAPHVKVNREQILNDRESRKKAKQLNKQLKKGAASKSDQQTTPVSHANDNLKKETVILKCVNDVKKESPIKEVVKEIKVFVNKTEGSEQQKETVVVKNIEINNKHVKESVKVSLDSVTNASVGKPNSQKSREEVLAEREAKKKAKQMAKLKKNDNTELVNESPIVPHVKSSLKDEIVSNKEKTPVVPPPVAEPAGKSKAELRAERRAKQDAQRAAKQQEKKQKQEAVENKENKISPGGIKKNIVAEKETGVKEIKTPAKAKTVPGQQIKLFGHLRVGEKPSEYRIIQTIHPAILELGVKYSTRVINGSNARCVALLKCLKEVITDYTTPSEKEFSRGLESTLGELTCYINQCRPMSVSMTNALRHIKSHLTQLPNSVSDDEAKRKLCDVIDTFIREQIDVAGEAICETVKNKILNGDVILIYSCSSLLYRILTESHNSGRQFRVVVVDGGPWFEGREMLRRLVAAGLKCTYVLVSAISFIMKKATKVLLGAHALLANGCVMSRAGAAIVALTAHSYNVPVLVCCETYKFCERVQTDAFVYNELGNPDDVVKDDERLANWRTQTSLSPLSLVYDITPPDLVTAVVTEIAILPCTSVPVILRVKPSDVVS